MVLGNCTNVPGYFHDFSPCPLWKDTVFFAWDPEMHQRSSNDNILLKNLQTTPPSPGWTGSTGMGHGSGAPRRRARPRAARQHGGGHQVPRGSPAGASYPSPPSLGEGRPDSYLGLWSGLRYLRNICGLGTRGERCVVRAGRGFAGGGFRFGGADRGLGCLTKPQISPRHQWPVAIWCLPWAGASPHRAPPSPRSQ